MQYPFRGDHVGILWTFDNRPCFVAFETSEFSSDGFLPFRPIRMPFCLLIDGVQTLCCIHHHCHRPILFLCFPSSSCLFLLYGLLWYHLQTLWHSISMRLLPRPSLESIPSSKVEV